MKRIELHRIKFYEFLNGDISNIEFENWVYEEKSLDTILPKDHFEDLISFSFNSNELKPYISKLVKSFFDVKEYEYWRTLKLLGKIETDEIEIVLATRKMRMLYLEQKESLGEPLLSKQLALGCESELDNFPIETEYHLWNQKRLKVYLEPVGAYKNEVKRIASQEMSNLQLVKKKEKSN